MELIDSILQVLQSSMDAAALSDLEIGTVKTVDPLSVVTQDVQDPIPAVALILTAAVVEKKIPILTHNHEIHDTFTGGGSSMDALTGIVCYENGKALPIKDGCIILNRALEAGDKVIMLRVLSGQKHIILSRAF